MSRSIGSLASCSEVSTVRVSTEDTSMAGRAEATTETPSRFFASVAAAAEAPKDTSVPPAMLSSTLSRVLTAAPLFFSVTL